MVHSELMQRLQKVIKTRITSDKDFQVYKELEKVLEEIGLRISNSGGKVTFYGKDPIVNSTIRLGSGAAIGLMTKTIAAANLYRIRVGKGQDLHVDLAKALERLGVSYKMLEHLNDYPVDFSDISFFELFRFYETKDNRHVIPCNIYPKLRNKMQAILGCNNNSDSVAKAIAKYNAIELENLAEENGIVMGMVRTLEEFMQENVFTDYLINTKLIDINKIADSEPEPLSQNPSTPLERVRALGLGHVIAGAGIGRTLACHGADVLNIWRLNEFEHDATYITANVGMRSARLDYKSINGKARLINLLKDADIFFANRRPVLMQEIGLTAEECVKIRPGIIYCNTTTYGDSGPWINRPGFDQVAGSVTGMMAFEGSRDEPKLPVINVVNDYLVAWLAAAGCMAALSRRSTEGGSYRVHVSLARVSLWLMSLGIFDKNYVAKAAGKDKGHEEMTPELFVTQTPMGKYQGYTDQVRMSETPESYLTILEPRGSNHPIWLPHN